MEPEEKLTRRNFLSGVATIGLSSTLGSGLLFTSCSEKGKQVPLHPVEELYIPELPDKAIDGKPIKAALIGCGGRGIGAAFNFLDAGNDRQRKRPERYIRERGKSRNHRPTKTTGFPKTEE